MTSANPWRLVFGQDSYADFSVSVSPAVEKAVALGVAPSTVFIDMFGSDSVTIGANEDPNQVLDLPFCRERGVTVRRRPNGGGAIYAGAGSAFMVFYLKTDQPRVPQSAADAFPAVLGATADVLQRLYGVPARYRPLNDVEIDGRKLMPTSVKLENGVLTFRILLNIKAIDTDVAARALPMPPEKVKDKVHKDLGSRYTWLEREIGRPVTLDDLTELATAVAMEAFAPPALQPGDLTAQERGWAEEFRRTLESDDWLYQNAFDRRLRPLLQPGDRIGDGREKAVGGMIWATLLVRAGHVAGAVINGDWHPRPLESVAWLEESLIGAAAEPAAVEERIAAFLARPNVEFAGVRVEDLTAACAKALAGLIAAE